MKAAERYQQAEALRQAILDYANAQRRAVSVPEMATALKQRRQMVSNTARAMELLGELRRHGSHKALRYTAIAAKTMDAQTMTERANNLRSVALKQEKQESAPVPQSSTGYYRHNGMNRAHPIKEQGGQGGVQVWFGGIKSSLA